MSVAVTLLRIDSSLFGPDTPIVPASDYLEMLGQDGARHTLLSELHALGDGLSSALHGIAAEGDPPGILVIEASSPSITESEIAAFTVMISQALDELNISTLVISVPRIDDLVGSNRLHSLFRTGIDTMVLDEQNRYEVHRGGAIERVGSGLKRRAATGVALPRITAGELLLSFGHFSAQFPELKLHGNTVPNIEGLREKGREDGWARLVSTLDQDLRRLTSGRQFALHPLDWFEGELSSLSIQLCDDERRAVWYPGMPLPDTTSLVVTLSSTPLSRDVHDYLTRKRRVPNDVEVLHWNILGTPGGDVPCSVEVSPVARTFSPWSCPYCGQNVPLEGDASDSRQLGVLHPKLFWDLISWQPDCLDHSHWKSSLTPNHFNLRLNAKPIFDVFSASIAHRMLNALEMRGVKRSWIDGIVCTAGSESVSIVPQLQKILGLEDDSVVVMDDAMRELALGAARFRELSAAVEAQRDGGKNIVAGNVIIVDQAAHHMTTRAALRRVADHHEARTLAFVVFVDRAAPAGDSSGELEERDHYVPLYSWPCRPRTAGSCSCGELVELIS